MCTYIERTLRACCIYLYLYVNMYIHWACLGCRLRRRAVTAAHTNKDNKTKDLYINAYVYMCMKYVHIESFICCPSGFRLWWFTTAAARTRNGGAHAIHLGAALLSYIYICTCFEHRGPQCLLILTRSTGPSLDQFPVRVCACPLCIINRLCTLPYIELLVVFMARIAATRGSGGQPMYIYIYIYIHTYIYIYVYIFTLTCFVCCCLGSGLRRRTIAATRTNKSIKTTYLYINVYVYVCV